MRASLKLADLSFELMKATQDKTFNTLPHEVQFNAQFQILVMPALEPRSVMREDKIFESAGVQLKCLDRAQEYKLKITPTLVRSRFLFKKVLYFYKRVNWIQQGYSHIKVKRGDSVVI